LTRKEKGEVVDRVLDHYEAVGDLIVGDDVSLCQLLVTLEINAEDHAIGDYLSSFLTV
jgi:uncharacterized protein YaiI (UPF0178 family)